MANQPSSSTRALLSRVGVEHPIVQAPMAGGATTPELIAAVCEAGALGSLGAAVTAPQKILDAVAAIRQRTSRPFNVNLFVLEEPRPDEPDTRARIQRAAELLAPIRRELGLPDVDIPARFCERFADQLAAVREAAPAVASFHFGIPPLGELRAIQARGGLVLGSATNAAEARAWEEAGADIICAQGAEAGGHRGTFLGSVEESLIGTMVLAPMVAAAVKVPVLAAGGIMDGRAIAAALGLGAAGVQMGTAFLPCPESGIHPDYKRALTSPAAARTVVTRAFSGRAARGIVNRYLELMHPHQDEVPVYPIMNAMTSELRATSGKAGRMDFVSLWAGQGAPMSRALPAAELVRRLVAEAAGDPIAAA
ncbi:MAG TPA: nitronate monooxygenase [Kofleriaceae bacterium]|nr:nitronate monooxygenase [Kofleriaceae bacterium]